MNNTRISYPIYERVWIMQNPCPEYIRNNLFQFISNIVSSPSPFLRRRTNRGRNLPSRRINPRMRGWPGCDVLLLVAPWRDHYSTLVWEDLGGRMMTRFVFSFTLIDSKISSNFFSLLREIQENTNLVIIPDFWIRLLKQYKWDQGSYSQEFKIKHQRFKKEKHSLCW